jgi:hypothetical protein
VTIAETEQRARGQMPSGRIPADRAWPLGAHGRASLVSEQPKSRRLAVVGRRGIRILGREAVVDADDGQPGVARQPLEARVLPVAFTERPSAAVDVEERSTRLAIGRNDPQRKRSARTVDLDHARFGHVHRRGEDAATLAASPAALLGRHLVDRRDRRQPPLELGVERTRLGEQGVGIGRRHGRGDCTQ